MMENKLPYLTANLAGIGGKIKTIPEDFYVEEIPLYHPSGKGEHIYLTFRKTGTTTLKVINMVAKELKIHSKKIGYAGLKDAHAVTQQTISISDVSLEQVSKLNIPGVEIIGVKRHRNKLKLGHLAGNKFIIKIRDVEENSFAQAETILNYLKDYGVPNYFGQQRFGIRDNSHLLGLAIIKQNSSEFLAEFLGRPHPDENKQVQESRTMFDAGDWVQALETWPAMLAAERTVLQKLVKSGDELIAVKALDRRLKRLFVSACQSHLFNQLLAQRIDKFNQIEVGDVAYIHKNGACFVVDSVEKEQPRVDSFEISPAGPLFGIKYLTAQGEVGLREQALLNKVSLVITDFNVSNLNMNGARRTYRMPLTDVNLKWDEGLVVSFVIPSGGYATTVLGEVMKND